MNPEVKLLTSVFSISFVTLLAATSGEFRARRAMLWHEAEGHGAPVGTPTPALPVAAATTRPPRDDAAVEQVDDTDPDVAVAAVPKQPDESPRQEASPISPAAEAIRQLAYSGDPQAIDMAAEALRSAQDSQLRAAAVQSLLLLGRKSMVDPRIPKALEAAANDADPAIAALANTALIEVRRETH